MNDLKFYTANIEGLTLDCVVGRDVAHRFPLHSHRSLCIGLVTEGVRNMKVGNTFLNISENDVFIINPNQPHAIEEATASHSYIAITVNGLTNNVAFQNLVRSETVIALIKSVSEAIIQKNDNLAVQWTMLFNHLKTNYLIADSAVPSDLLFQKVEKYIMDNYSNQVAVGEMAKAACMSKFHFCRQFRQTVGMSPHIYLINWRLRHANKCLKNNMPVFDAAIDAGFYDSSHLIKTFRSYMAVSPDDYRKAFR
ncbi:MAG: AraC family transcriptional regulator [Tannerella sp.]|jgi:AraC-like DNA-binding protein|nr:AraC family transcriptional regulator [Tannerella sp.]